MCNDCNQKVDPCGCQEEITFCGCPQKVDMICTYYTGKPIPELGITKGMDGQKVLEKIVDFLSNLPEYDIPEPSPEPSQGGGSWDFIDPIEPVEGLRIIDLTI